MIFKRFIERRGLGTSESHLLATMGGRTLQDLNKTIQEANYNRDIAWIFKRGGLYLELRRKQAIRVRGSGDNSENKNAPINHNPSTNDARDEGQLFALMNWECPECFMHIWAPHHPRSCHRCGLILPPGNDMALSFTPAAPIDGHCVACGKAGTRGGQCDECGGPIEPDDQSCHYHNGWRHGPRPPGSHLDIIPANLGNAHENIANDHIAQIIFGLEGILAPPYSTATKSIIEGALKRLDNNHIFRIKRQQHPAKENAVARLVANHLTSNDPRLATIAPMLDIGHPSLITALLGAASRRTVLSKIISDDGTHLANQNTICTFINELSSWAQLKTWTLGSGHKIPDPFPIDTKYDEAQALVNAALYDDSVGYDHMVTNILNRTTNPLRMIVLGHEALPRKALRSLPRHQLEDLSLSPTCTLNAYIADVTTEFIVNESRRLKILRAFVNLRQPAACYAMILTAETISSFDPYIDHRGILRHNISNIQDLMDITCNTAKLDCIAKPTFTHQTPPELGLDILCLEDLGKALIHNHLMQQAPSLFVPYTAVISRTRDPPDANTREAITSYLGRPLPWEPEVWDGNICPSKEIMENTFGFITWKQAFYLHKHHNVRMGGEAVQHPSCEFCGISWTFWFTGPCPLCIRPTYATPNTQDRIKRGIRVIMKIAKARLILIDLLESVQARHNSINSATSTFQTTPLHVIVIKGYSALFTIQNGHMANIGFQTLVGPEDNIFAKAAQLIRDKTNIAAEASDLIAYPGSARDGANILFYPSIERDIWVRIPGTLVEAEFGCLSVLKYLPRTFEKPALHQEILQLLNYMFNDPRAQYSQIMAKCHICGSLGPVGSKCKHDPQEYGCHPHHCRLETGIVGFLQGRQADCHICGQQS